MTFDLCTQNDNKNANLFISCHRKENYFSKTVQRILWGFFSFYWTEAEVEERKKREGIVWCKKGDVSP